ncbi:MAG: DUF421 domain-containing protein [Bacillota bacterium]|nr:DUF421 domain-containing protein [Bacillota bacterium]
MWYHAAIVVRTLAMFLFVFVALRLAGKRELGQISPFDFVVSVMVGELAAIPLQSPRIPLTHGMLPIATLIAAEVAVAYLSLKSRTLRVLFSGSPTIVIQNGAINERNLRRTRYNLDDLLASLRQQGVANLADVEYAILEDNGQLSVLLKSHKRPVTPEDLGIVKEYDGLPLTLIIDGKVDERALALAGRDEEWLRQELGRRGYARAEEVLLATLDAAGHLYVAGKEKPGA